MNKLLVALVASAFVVTSVIAAEEVKVEKVVTLKGTVVVAKDEAGMAKSVAVKDADGKETILVMNEKAVALDGKADLVVGTESAEGVVVKEIKEVKVEAPEAEAPQAPEVD